MGEGLNIASVLRWALIFVLLTLAGCGGNEMERAQPGRESPAREVGQDDRPSRNAAEGCRPSGASLSVSAKDIKFDKDCLAAPAGQAFSIEFDNEEPLPHNVAILPEHDSTEALFRGEVFTGPATRRYEVSALQPGSYHFHCDVHPEMQGDFIVQ